MEEWTQFHAYILQLEAEGLVSRTFRRLDPERQVLILEAIVDEAVARGPTALNIKEVASRAGVSVGSLYAYFPDREGMLAFAVELSRRFVTDAFEQYRPYLAQMPLRQALEAYFSGGIEWSQAYAALVRLFARAAYHGDPELSEQLVRPIATLLREMVGDILAAAIERGEVRPDVDLEAATRIVHALTIVVGDSHLLPYLNTYFQVTGEEVTEERALETMIDLVLHGIGEPESKEEKDG